MPDALSEKVLSRRNLALHTRARLGVDEDRRKGRLLADGRLQQLKALAEIDLLPRRQLDVHQTEPDGPRRGR